MTMPCGGVAAVQTFGDFQNFNPHLHIIATDGCFYGQGRFQKANQPCPTDLEPLFRQEVFKLLIIDSGLSNKAFRKSWARLIQKVYEVDPLLCPKCQGQMKIISFIEEQVVIKQILQHLGLWEILNTGPPKGTHLNVVRELTYQVAPDQGPPDD